MDGDQVKCEQRLAELDRSISRRFDELRELLRQQHLDDQMWLMASVWLPMLFLLAITIARR